MNQFEEVLTQTLKELAEHERNNPEWDSNIIPAYDTLIASHNAEVERERRGEWQQMLLDAKGNEEAGYKPSRSWFISYAEDRLEAIKKHGGKGE